MWLYQATCNLSGPLPRPTGVRSLHRTTPTAAACKHGPGRTGADTALDGSVAVQEHRVAHRKHRHG
jgi:hypothetical protein